MSAELDKDLAQQLAALDSARIDLRSTVTSLNDDDLERGRRGGWTVRRVLEHVIWSEHLYARLTAHLRGRAADGELGDNSPASVSDALERLTASRSALTAALDGVDEDTFYRLQQIGHEEYSVLSLLENTVNHDREHTAQLREIVSN